MTDADFVLVDVEPKVSVADGYDVCTTCGKTLKATASGTLRRHKCEPQGETVTTVPDVKRPTVARRKSRTQAPDKVVRLGVAVVAAGVEWTTDQVLSKATDLPPSQIPSELPDPDAMIGPFLQLMWPQIPKGAQKALTELADHEDLIAATFAWFAWAQTLKEFTETVNAAKVSREETSDGGTFQVPATVAGSVHEYPGAPAFTVADPSV